MGHYTVLGESADEALAKALEIRSRLSPHFDLQAA
jgi:hypothetical protein